MKVECGLQMADEFLALSTIPALLYTFIERGILHMNTTVLGARYDVYCQDFHGVRANAWMGQYMGLHPACDGSRQDIQVESSLSAWNNTNTYLDNAPRNGVIRLILDSQYQLLGPCMWAGLWLRV